MPEEWGALTRLLDYDDPTAVAEVLEAMAGQVSQRSRVEKQGFKGRLQVLALTSPYPEVRRPGRRDSGQSLAGQAPGAGSGFPWH